MKSFIFALSSLLATAVVAQAHRHQQLHNKRDSALVVVTDWVTDWVTETETVDFVETFTVTPGYVAPTTWLKVTSTSSSTTSSPSTSSTSSTSSNGGQFFQGQSSSTTTTTIRVAHATSSSVTEPSTPPASTPTASTSVYLPPASAPSAPQATTSPSTPSSGSGSSSGSESGGSMSGCTPGTPCTGDITWYNTGVGSCGIYSENTESVVALSVDLMAPHKGTNPNNNPYCGQMITIKLPSGATTTAKVVDTCTSCSVDSIDLSSAAFSSLTPLSVGRTPATWWFN